jgi:murein DD-endopeptidase MepM/ murein hydrolase activator NlpD
MALLLYAAAVTDANPADTSPLNNIVPLGNQADDGAPDTDPHDIPFETWFPTEKPGGSDDEAGDAPAILPPVPVDSEHTVKRGDTLKAVLNRAGIASHEAEQAIRTLKKVYDPRRLRPGTQLFFEFLPPVRDGEKPNLLSLDFSATGTLDISVLREPDSGFSAETHKRALNTGLAYASGRIASSLYKSGTRAGLPTATLISFIHMFSFDVDFQREGRSGDAFEILYEWLADDAGTTVGEGDILIASLTLSGNNITLYRFRTDKGFADYFDEDGRSAQKSLLRTPTDATRISSGFGRRRHPILGYTRMHKGTDFSAPRGTPIYAAGDGVIEKAGWAGGYGKYVRIRHNGQYKTAYAHMRGFGRGIKAGVRVKQRDIIGYVGSTGRSTGPHLHYEVHYNGRQINPKKVRLPAGYRLKGQEFERYKSVLATLRTRLTNLKKGGKPADTLAQDRKK